MFLPQTCTKGWQKSIVKGQKNQDKLDHMRAKPFPIKHVINYMAYELQLQPTILLCLYSTYCY